MKTYTHTDKLGRELVVNDVVVYSSFHSGLTIGKIDVLNRVRVRLTELGNPRKRCEYEDINPRDTVKVDSKDVEFYLLKNAK